jgi:hypothetical protein
MGCVFIMAVIILLLWKASCARYLYYTGPREFKEKAAELFKVVYIEKLNIDNG